MSLECAVSFSYFSEVLVTFLIVYSDIWFILFGGEGEKRKES